jgi:two-component system CheB/CheR fusion protein
VAALENLAARSAATYGVRCRLEHRGTIVIPNKNDATQLFRIAQEAVINAAQHSKGTELIVRLREEPQQYVLEVEDDGRGILPPAPSADGMGLQIMRYRASLIGAQLTISARPGAGTGTLVRCILPKES